MIDNPLDIQLFPENSIQAMKLQKAKASHLERGMLNNLEIKTPQLQFNK